MEVGYAILYEDEELVISKNHTILSKKIEIDYGKFDDTNVPWKDESSQIKKVQILDQVKSNCVKEWFETCINLKTLINFKNLDVSDCKDFSCMFGYCESLQDLNGLENWNVSNGTDFFGMFNNCNSLEDINALSNWNVSNGVNFSYMFLNCKSLQDLNALSNWNVSNGTKFNSMFAYCETLKKISLSNTLDILKKDIFYECNTILKIRWKNHIYTYEDLLQYEEIY